MYNYETERPYVFTDEGQRRFLKVRDEANRLYDLAGAVRVDKLLLGGGDSWKMLALIDRLVELEEFHYVYHKDAAKQYHILIK